MKGEATLKILHALADAGIGTAINIADFTAAFLEAGYGASSSRLEYFINKRQRDREKRMYRTDEKQRFYKLLYKLKKEGLVERVGKQSGGKISITQKGFNRLNFLKGRLQTKLPRRNYDTQKTNELKVVVFDIPEKEKIKRQWLREQLISLGFTMIQKSVWAGKNKLPQLFINDCKDLGVLPYTEIFEITKKGSLTKTTS